LDETNVKVYGYRWVVLGVFMLINVTMQILWICFAPVTGPAAAYYHVTDLEIGYLAIAFMVVFIPLAIPASWAIDTWGFRKAVGLGALLMGVFGLLRGLYTTSYTTTMIFTIGIAAGQPFLLNSWTKVAARWFPLKERATAVGLAAVATFIGIGIGQGATPYLVLQYGLGTTQLIYGVAAAISTVVFLIVARENPPTPASPAGYENRALVLDGIKQILRRPDFYYLAFALFVGGGIFNGVATWVETMVRPKGLSITDAGLMGLVMLIGGIVGAAGLPAISDRYHMRKFVVLIGFALCIPGMIGLAFGTDFVLLLVSFFVVGLFTTGIGPVAYQYGAELTYPAPEGTSNGLFGLAVQLSVVMITAMGWLYEQTHSFTSSLLALVALTVVGCIMLALLNESPMMARSTATVSGD
jgi:MFS family permease